MINRLRRLPTVARALSAARDLESHDRWDRDQLERHQQSRLVSIVRHAAAHSPYYREQFAGIELTEDLDVTVLPTLDKATMLERFDEIVTDRRLSLAAVEGHLAELESLGDDPLLFGEYRAMASGGTTGRRGVFVYGDDDWAEILAGLLRWTGGFIGLTPRLPRRRMATIAADSPLHMTGRMGRSIDVGVARQLNLDARSPLPDLVDALNRQRPQSLAGYPSVVSLLAEEQLAGRLRISPRVVGTTSEVCTVDMREAIESAWGGVPFNGYASTETGMLAGDCDRHAGLHLFSDLTLFEVVDDDRRPVSPGQPGNRVLVTNLINRAQPLIRFELDDLVAVAPEHCPCGRPHPLLERVDGRSDDVLDLPAVEGGTVAVHPLAIRAPLGSFPEVREYRVVRETDALRVEAVLVGVNGDLERVTAAISERLRSSLADAGARPPRVVVEQVAEIPRNSRSGKRRLIVSSA